MSSPFSGGAPVQLPSHGPIRRKSGRLLYRLASSMASRSAQNLHSSMLFERAHEEPPTLSSSNGPLHSTYGRFSSLLTPSSATKSMQDLSVTALESVHNDIPIMSTLSDVEVRRTTHRIRRFLLWNLAFTYEIEPETFRCYLFDDAVSGTYELDDGDIMYLTSLGQCLQRACDRVRQNQLSLLVADDRSRVIEDVLIPARALNIKPEYLCDQVMSFPDHQFDNNKRHKTVLYSQSTKKSIFGSARKWGGEEPRAHLAQCLVSDDYIVSEVAPTEQLQVVLGRCIAQFSDKHCRKGMDMGSVERRVYFQESTYRLLLAVKLRMQIAQQTNVRSEPPRFPLRNRSKSATYQPTTFASLQGPFNANPATYREEDEEVQGETLEST